MPFTRGQRLGPYEIVGSLGAGGMGEVYRATDTRLDRAVAVKVLPELASTPEAQRRFEIEARAISSLSHPHICALYDVGRQDGVDYLVMELIEGETLEAILRREPPPLERALAWAAQIADGLGRAHRQGVVHRDLKPGNVMITRNGVKLLDFGLARIGAGAVLPLTPELDLSRRPTRLAPLTAEGSLVGTLFYMAPEQLEGAAADHRADIFAFGAVLSEMVTGARAFDGASSASVISAILRDQPPPVSARVPAAPPSLDWLIERCLAKDPEERWQNVQDLRLHLQAIAAELGRGPAGRARPGRRWLAPGAVALALVALALGLAWPRPPAATPGRAVRFELPVPTGGRFVDWVEAVSMAISPDGDTLAMVAAVPASAPPMVWLRPLASLEARPLKGTEGAISIFFAPDGSELGFFAGGKLKRVALDGGAPVPICDAPTGVGYAGSWGADGTIVFATIQGQRLQRVAASGGEPTSFRELDAAPSEVRVSWPFFLPDGRGLLYLSTLHGGETRLMLAPPGGGSPLEVARGVSRAEYVDPGYLVLSREGSLIAQRLDVATGRLVGAPVNLAPKLRTFGSTGAAAFATSRSGAVIYAGQIPMQRLSLFDRAGKLVRTVGEPGEMVSVNLSPDGRRAIFDRLQPGVASYDLWLADLERGVETRLTSEPRTEVYGLWSPDAKTIFFSAVYSNVPQLFRLDLASGRQEKVLAQDSRRFQTADGITPDGRELVFRERSEQGNQQLQRLVLDGGGPEPILPGNVRVSAAALSPDGRWVAFVGSESGRGEAYVRPLHGEGENVRVSVDGARNIRFSRDGRQLLFLSPNRRQLLAATFESAPTLRIGQPAVRFEMPGLGWSAFDVAPDGRFLAVVQEIDHNLAPLTVALDWVSEATAAAEPR